MSCAGFANIKIIDSSFQPAASRLARNYWLSRLLHRFLLEFKTDEYQNACTRTLFELEKN